MKEIKKVSSKELLIELSSRADVVVFGMTEDQITAYIKDEYDREVTEDELWEIIDSYKEASYRRNLTASGPNLEKIIENILY